MGSETFAIFPILHVNAMDLHTIQKNFNIYLIYLKLKAKL